MQEDKLETSYGPEQVFHEYLRESRFMIQRSRSTGQYVFYPRVMVPATGEQDLEWVEAAGTGVVYAITVNRGRDENYNIALVELDEGVRMMTRIDGVEIVPIGTKVKARIIGSDESPMIVFVPVAGEH